jgi:hypothetical protein
MDDLRVATGGEVTGGETLTARENVDDEKGHNDKDVSVPTSFVCNEFSTRHLHFKQFPSLKDLGFLVGVL